MTDKLEELAKWLENLDERSADSPLTEQRLRAAAACVRELADKRYAQLDDALRYVMDGDCDPSLNDTTDAALREAFP